MTSKLSQLSEVSMQESYMLDRRLNNYRKWMHIRRRFFKKMNTLMNRQAAELLVNADKHLRCKIEEKLALQYTVVPQIRDKYRGKPSWWQLPPRSLRYPSLLAVPTKLQLDEIPSIDYVHVPTKIQERRYKESANWQRINLWEKSSYRIRRVKELQKKLRRVQPYKPTELDLDKLIVVGTLIKDPSKTLDESSITPRQMTESEKQRVQQQEVIEKTIALSIEGKTFKQGNRQKVESHCMSFTYDVSTQKAAVQYITLKNIGNVSLRYYWMKPIQEKVLTDILPLRTKPLYFFFTKNETVILPGENKVIPVYFQTDKPGIHKETWELRTEPTIYSKKKLKDSKFLLVLWANAEIGTLKDIANTIRSRVDEGVRSTAVCNTFNHFIKDIHIKVQQQPAPTNFIREKEIFEAMNADFGDSGQNPLIYYYDQSVVSDLIVLYNRVRTAEDPHTWTYRIADLETAIDKIRDTEEKQNYRFKFQQCVGQLFKTRMIENTEQEKYSTVYNLLCTMVDQMTEKVYDLREQFKIRRGEKYPAVTEETILKLLDDENPRKVLFYQNFGDCDARHIQMGHEDTSKNRPAMECLKAVPNDDVKLKHKLYHKEKYGIDVTDSGNMTAVGKKDAASKPKKPDTKSKNNKEKQQSIAQESYQPLPLTELLSDEVLFCDERENTSDKEHAVSPNSQYMYNYNMYIFINHYLNQTISDIESMLEMYHTNRQMTRRVTKTCIELGIPIAESHKRMKVESLSAEEKHKLFHILDSSSESESESNQMETLSELSRPYSAENFDSLYFYSNFENFLQVQYVDAQTETSDAEVCSPRIKEEFVQTVPCAADSQFDVVAQIELEMDCTELFMSNKQTQTNLSFLRTHPKNIKKSGR